MSRPVAQGRDPWLDIELRHLAALMAIEREGTISHAALSLGYVQSAISGQLASLERLTGTRLVERSRGPGQQTLTEAGQLLVAHSREILAELKVARERLAAGAAVLPDELRVAVARGVVDRVVGTVLSSALSERIGLKLTRVDTLAADQLIGALLDEKADVALTPLPLVHDELVVVEVARDDVVVVVRADADLVHDERLTIARLSQLPLVALREDREPSRIEAELRDRGLPSTVVAHTDGADTAVTLVAAGLGVAALPRGAVGADPRIRVLELDDELPARQTGLAWLQTRNTDLRLRRFVDLAGRESAKAQRDPVELDA